MQTFEITPPSTATSEPTPAVNGPALLRAENLGNQVGASKQPTRADFDIESIGGIQYAVHRDSGEMYPIAKNEQGVDVFCIGDRCFLK
jgi:hypothetical protein